MSRKLRHRSHHGEQNGEHEPAHDRHEEQELLAYQFWVERGQPVGTPEEDWFRAERQMEAATRL